MGRPDDPGIDFFFFEACLENRRRVPKTGVLVDLTRSVPACTFANCELRSLSTRTLSSFHDRYSRFGYCS